MAPSIFGHDQDGERIVESHEKTDEDVRESRRNGDAQHEKAVVGTQRSRDVIEGAVDAVNAGCRQYGDRDPGGQCYNKMLAWKVVGNRKNVAGIQGLAGTAPINLSSGMPQ